MHTFLVVWSFGFRKYQASNAKATAMTATIMSFTGFIFCMVILKTLKNCTNYNVEIRIKREF